MRHNLIKARKALDLTQKNLGELVGLSRPAICMLERGRINGSESTWKKLAAVLSATPEHLWQIADAQ